MANYKRYDVSPNTKPRMTQRDRWKERKCVLNYRAYADAVRDLDIKVSNCCHHLVFVLPMAKTWPKYKKRELLHQPHEQTPDRDNLDKALLDAVFKHKDGGDQHVWDGRITKIWGEFGAVLVGEIDPPPMDEIIYALTQEQLELNDQPEQLALEG